MISIKCKLGLHDDYDNLNFKIKKKCSRCGQVLTIDKPEMILGSPTFLGSVIVYDGGAISDNGRWTEIAPDCNEVE